MIKVGTIDDFWRAVERRSDDKPGKLERSYLPQPDGRRPKLTIYMALKIAADRGLRGSWESPKAIAEKVRERARIHRVGPATVAEITGLSVETTKKFLRGEHCLCLPPMLLLVAELDRRGSGLEPLALDLRPEAEPGATAGRGDDERVAREQEIADPDVPAEDAGRDADAGDEPTPLAVAGGDGVEAEEPLPRGADDSVNWAEAAPLKPECEHQEGPKSEAEEAPQAEVRRPPAGRSRQRAEPRNIDHRPLSAASTHSIPSTDMHVLVCRASDGREWVFREGSVDELLATLTRAVPRDVLRTAQVSIDRAPFNASMIVLEQRVDELNARIDAKAREPAEEPQAGIWSVGGLGFDLLKMVKEFLEDHRKERRDGKRANDR